MAGEAAAASAAVEAALDVPLDPTAAAFFDVDNTVMQGASIFHLARGLHRRDFFTTRDIVGAAWKQAYFRIVGVEDPEHVAEARSSALAFIAGHTVAELEELSEEIFDEGMAHRIWPGTRALAQLHLDQGQRVWLVTAAPVEIASIIARRLGLTGAMGTVAEHVDGVYTGRLVGDLLHGPAKAEAVRALAEREGLDLARCAAYSDSYNDLPMLSMVGEATRDQPGRPAAGARPRGRLAGARLPHRPQGGPGRPGDGGRGRGGQRRRGRRRGPARTPRIGRLTVRPVCYRSVPYPRIPAYPGRVPCWAQREDDACLGAVTTTSRAVSPRCVPPSWRPSAPTVPPSPGCCSPGRPRRPDRTCRRAREGTATPGWPRPRRTPRPSRPGSSRSWSWPGPATRTPSGCSTTTTPRRCTGSSTTAPARRPSPRT